MFKIVYSLYSAFCTQPVFYSQSVFYPWSAVCSPQSAFYTDRFLYYHAANYKTVHVIFHHWLLCEQSASGFLDMSERGRRLC